MGLDPKSAVMDVSNSKTRILYVDVLRILACISVVFIHCTIMIHNGDLIHSSRWLVADIINSATRWCVPAFFMLSGATILDYRERYSTAVFYKKRFVRVLIPFIIWTAIYLVWGAKSGIFVIGNFQDVLNRTVSGPAMYHLWFFYSLLGIYLVVPLLSVLTSHTSRKLLYLFVVFCIINNQILPLITKFTSVTIGFKIPLADSFLDYFLLGWLLKDASVKKGVRYGLYAVGFLCVVATAVLSYLLSQTSEDLYFMNYETLTTFFSTMAVFIFVKNVRWEKVIHGSFSSKAVRVLADSSFGIYLIHLIVKYYFVDIFHLVENSIRFMTVGTVCVYIISFIFVFVLRKIPVVKYLVP